MKQISRLSRRLLICATLTAAAPARSQTPGPRPDPVNAVKAFYDPKIRDERRPYSRRLKALYEAAKKKSRELNEPVSGLDFDPTSGSQDADDDFRETLVYAVERRSQGRALVSVKLRVFRSEPELTLFYDVIVENNAWRVDDISNPAEVDGWRLSAMLEAGARGQ